MGIIRVLDKDVAEKIAAGEVVERPISIVKELVENCIDAEATSVVIEFKKSGKSYIRVTDNGKGMESEDLPLAFLRHATSKVSTAKDLEGIDTLGFRGEALASISAVSHTEIISKTKESESGRRVIVKGGQLVDDSPIGCPEGTTVIVKDLFFNTPVREKFLKSDASESSQIIDFITQIALAYSNVKFHLINNGTTVFTTAGNGNKLETISILYDHELGKKLVNVEKTNDLIGNSGEKIKITGYVSNIGETRSSRKSQIFFVNGRVITSKIIEKAIDEAYREKLAKGRFPLAYLFIEISPNLIDVNIHPNKREIRFYNDEIVQRTITEAIKETLTYKEAIPSMNTKKTLYGNSELLSGNSEIINKKIGENLYEINKIIEADRQIKEEKKLNTTTTEQKELNQIDMNTLLEINKEIIEGKEEKEEDSKTNNAVRVKNSVEFNDINKSNKQDNTNNIEKFEKQDNTNNTEKFKEQDNTTSAEKPKAQDNRNDIKQGIFFEELNYQGTLFSTYLIFTDDENMYLIDQHAAHERVNYENMLKSFCQGKVDMQPIMIPVMINIATAQYENISQWKKPLDNFGFDIEDFGPNTIKVTGIPYFFTMEESELFINNFFDNLTEEIDLTDEITLEKVAEKACKASVKAKQNLRNDEIKALLKDLDKCKNHLTCPHGRPTLIKYIKMVK